VTGVGTKGIARVDQKLYKTLSRQCKQGVSWALLCSNAGKMNRKLATGFLIMYQTIYAMQDFIWCVCVCGKGRGESLLCEWSAKKFRFAMYVILLQQGDWGEGKIPVPPFPLYETLPWGH